MNSDFICVQKNSIYAYFHKSNSFKLLEQQKQNYMFGITWNGNKELFLSNESCVYNLTNKFKPKAPAVYSGGAKTIHQICCYDNELYIADTPNNRIVKIDAKNNELIFSINSATKGQDLNHVNSIFKKDNFIYVCCHNFYNPSFILIYDENFKLSEKIENIGKQCHNIYVENEWLYTLSSAAGEVIKYHLKTGNITKYDLKIYKNHFSNIFLRGLARGKDKFLIGATSLADQSRRGAYNYVAELDDDFQLKNFVHLPVSSELRDLRLLNEIDYAHNEIVYNLKEDIVI